MGDFIGSREHSEKGLALFALREPLIVLEAVILHTHTEEPFDVAKAVEELHQSSLIEITESETDHQAFLSVPLVAALFGKGKFETSPLNAQMRADTELLQHLGGSQRTDVRHGVAPRATRLIRSIARDAKGIEHYRPMLEFIARRDPPIWLELAKFYEEAEDTVNAKEALRHYLEQTPKEQWLEALGDLARLCQNTNDLSGEIDALVKQAELDDVKYRMISSAVNRLNSVLRTDYSIFSGDEKRVFAQRLRQAMEDGLTEATATDLSRLAWLCLRLGDESAADKYIRLGLSQEPDNEYCLRLVEYRSPH